MEIKIIRYLPMDSLWEKAQKNYERGREAGRKGIELAQIEIFGEAFVKAHPVESNFREKVHSANHFFFMEWLAGELGIAPESLRYTGYPVAVNSRQAWEELDNFCAKEGLALDGEQIRNDFFAVEIEGNGMWMVHAAKALWAFQFTSVLDWELKSLVNGAYGYPDSYLPFQASEVFGTAAVIDNPFA